MCIEEEEDVIVVLAFLEKSPPTMLLSLLDKDDDDAFLEMTRGELLRDRFSRGIDFRGERWCVGRSSDGISVDLNNERRNVRVCGFCVFVCVWGGSISPVHWG